MKKYKDGIRDFADGFLKNKKTALGLAFNAVRTGDSLEEALAAFAADPRPEDAEETLLHEKQHREISRLATHFQLLLNGSGRTYEELVRNTYGSAGKYQRFQDKLFDLEGG